ncbi:MAG: cobalamin B12-binding domain-containing protein [Conexivisphaerales archaeon]
MSSARLRTGSKVTKILVAKAGLDGHDRGAKVIARALMQAGYEVIYLGVHQTVRSIVNSAIDEDADLIAISILSGSHMEFAQDIIHMLKEKGFSRPVIMGGIIPSQDIPKLKRLGIQLIFGPGTSIEDIIKSIRMLLLEKKV